MTIAEKIARLSESDIAHIQGCIEQTISDEEKQTIEIKRRNIEKWNRLYLSEITSMEEKRKGDSVRRTFTEMYEEENINGLYKNVPLGIPRRCRYAQG